MHGARRTVERTAHGARGERSEWSGGKQSKAHCPSINLTQLLLYDKQQGFSAAVKKNPADLR